MTCLACYECKLPRTHNNDVPFTSYFSICLIHSKVLDKKKNWTEVSHQKSSRHKRVNANFMYKYYIDVRDRSQMTSARRGEGGGGGGEGSEKLTKVDILGLQS